MKVGIITPGDIMQVISLNPQNYYYIERLYNDFVSRAMIDFGFEAEPIDFHGLKNSLLSEFNKGYFVLDNNMAIGLMLFSDMLNDSLEITLLLGSEYAKKALLKQFLYDMKKFYHNKIVSFPLLGIQSQSKEILSTLGFDFVKESILEISKFPVSIPVLSKGYSLSVWENTFIPNASRVIFETFSKLNDTKFDPRFLSYSGCKGIVELIVNGTLGVFLPNATTVLLFNNEPVGFCFVNLTTEKIANIPILAIDKMHQAKKLGSVIVKNSVSNLEKIKRSSSNFVNLFNVTCDADNIPAINTYINAGFKTSNSYYHAYLTI